jgi:hypothetical protein
MRREPEWESRLMQAIRNGLDVRIGRHGFGALLVIGILLLIFLPLALRW